MARAGEEIENALSGERIVFRLCASETDGRLLELDSFWTSAGHRVPEHTHPAMQERWEVIAGNASFRIGGRERSGGPGDVLIAPPGVAHRAWNSGPGTVHVRIQMTPALGWEHFTTRLFGLANSAHAAGERAIDSSQLARLMGDFPVEIAL